MLLGVSRYLQQHCSRLRFIKILALFVFLINAGQAGAEVQSVTVSVDLNNTITVDLRNSISNITNPIVRIASQPANGSASAVACLDSTVQCVLYVPNTDFVGINTFGYVVANDSGVDESATIRIKVGEPGQTSQGQLPEAAVDGALSEVCLDETEGELVDLCAAFNQATNSGVPEDLRQLLNALSPQDVAAFGTITNELAAQQLTNIGKRLAALRRGSQGFSVGGLAFKQDGFTLPGSLVDSFLTGNLTGGGASADTSNKPWSVFVSGDIGGGAQQESDFEDGFDFLSMGVTTGIDFRLSTWGIVGSAVGYANSNTKVENVGGGLDVNGFNFILYGSVFPINNLSMDAIITTNLYRFSSQRRIIFGTTDATAKSETDSLSLASSVSITYDVLSKKGFTGSVVGKFEYISTNIDGFTESGAFPFDIVIEDKKFNQMNSLFGLQSTYAISVKWGAIIPQMDFSWVAKINNDNDPIKGYFAADPKKTPFSFDANAPDNHYFRLSMGVSTVIVNRGTGFFQYSTTLAKNYYSDWHIAAGWRFEF